MAFVVQIAFFTSLLVQVLSVDQSLHVIVVDGRHGNDTIECMHSNSTSCRSLSFIAQKLTQKYSIEIEISGKLLNLTVPVEFNNYTNLMITGSGRETTLHCNKPEAGLAFVSVKNLTIYSLTIENCGAPRNSTCVNPPNATFTEKLSVAVYILNCTDVTIHRVDILSSNGTGLSFYDTNRVVNITHSNFKNNRMLNQTVQSGGGGVHIEFTICTPGSVGNCSGHNGQNTNSSYTIQACTFSNNMASAPEVEHTFISTSNTPRIGKGGGLYISIGSDAAYNNFIIQDCHFESNTARFVAGGMLAGFLNSVRHNSISVYNSDFVGNNCTGTDSSSGGALVVGLMFYTESHVYGLLPSNNSFLCVLCNFTRNHAYMHGGGMSIYAAKNKNTSYGLSNITFSNCKWIENTSPLGAGVFITPAIWDYTNEGFLPVIQFRDCIFDSNTAIQELPSLGTRLNVTSVGYGALYSSQFRIRMMGNLYFVQNSGSAVHLSNSVLKVESGSNVTFYKNIAHCGGAIAMYGTSIIRVDQNTTIKFMKNRAYSKGGAMYVEFTDSLQPIYRNCFIEPPSNSHTKANSTIIFRGNNASLGGSSIYATTFRSCKMLCNRQNSTYPKDIMQCIANFIFDCSKDSLVTMPENFVLNTLPNSSIEIVPGAEYQLPLTAIDETKKNLSGMVYEAAITNSSMLVDPAFRQVSDNIIRILGNVSDTGILHLHISDVSLSFNVTLVDCQPGYYFTGLKCECASVDFLGLVGCEPIYLKQGYWLGYCSNGSSKLCTTYCPYGFCSYSHMSSIADYHALPNDSRSLDSHVCGPYRTGTACGKCTKDLSVYFNSRTTRCGSEELCDVGWLFYLLSEIIPLIILFLVILYFNISFTSGNINCFVFYAQILDSLATDGNGTLEFEPYVKVMREILSQLYRPLNLKFFSLEPMSFCLWKGAGVLDMFLMKYVTVGFALALVLLTILLVRCQCTKFRVFQTPNSVLIHGLSAFFVLCYSQAARATFEILTYFCLYSHKFHCEQRIVNRVGYMTYLGDEHIKYAVIASFFLVFIVIIPPLLLLIYPLVFKLLGLCKLSESKLASVLWRVMPIQLLDAFQSSFKDEYRFFAAFYFLYRAMVLCAFAYCEIALAFYSIVQLMLILALAIHAVFQPHKKREHNIIDTLLFTDLAIINAITLYCYARKDFAVRSNQGTITFMILIQAVLILLPFLMAVVLGVAKWKRRRKREKDSDDLPPLRSGEYKPLLQH